MAASKPITQEDLAELHEKLDLIFFAQAEILVRMKQEPEESAHYPLYQGEALSVAVAIEQDDIRAARQLMLNQLASNKVADEMPAPRRRSALPSIIK